MKIKKLSAILLAGALMATPVVTTAAMAESSQTESAEQNIVDPSGNLVIEGTTVTGVTEQGKTAKELVFPEGVTYIEYNALYDVSEVETISLPSTLSDIETSMMGSYPFGFSNLKSINVSPDNTTFFSEDGVLFCRGGWTENKLCCYPAAKTDTEYSIPENTELCSYVFGSNKYLLKINLPDSTMFNGYYIFGSDIVLNYMGRDYTADEIYYINPDEYSDYEKRVYDENGLYIVDNEIIDCINCQKDVVIPDNVTKIGDRAFAGCWGFEEIKIPESVTEIGDFAFTECKSLKKITIPKSITKISVGAFSQCTNLTEIVLPETLTEIETQAFAETSIKSITIPESVTEIGEQAFQECQDLTTIEIPKNVTKLSRTFYNCTNLTEVKFPEGLKEIGNGTFEKCTSLENIEIPAGVTKIGAWAFSKTNIKTLKIPGSVTELGVSICYLVPLTDVYFDNTKENWDNITVLDKAGNKTDGTATELFANSTIHFKTNDPEEKPVVEYTADEKTGVTASTEEGVIEEGSVLTVTPVEEKTENENTFGFDISFKNGEKEVQPNGKVTIKIPVPEPLKKLAKIYVYHVLNGKYYDMKAYIDDNGNIVFETDHFSEYVVTSEKVEGAIESEPSDSETDSNSSNSGATSPETGVAGLSLTLGIVALAGAAIVISRKKTR